MQLVILVPDWTDAFSGRNFQGVALEGKDTHKKGINQYLAEGWEVVSVTANTATPSWLLVIEKNELTPDDLRLRETLAKKDFHRDRSMER